MRSIALLILLGACGDPADSTADTDTSDTQVDTDTTDTNVDGTIEFSADIQPIFDKQCVSCHKTNGYISPSLEDASQLIGANTAYCEDGELPFIVPGDPDASFLVYKIGGGGPTPHGTQCKALMPDRRDNKSLQDLDPDAVATIRQWIAEGAHTD